MSKLFNQLLAKYITCASENHLIMKDSVNIYLTGREIELMTYGMSELIRLGHYREARMIARLVWSELTFEQFCDAVSLGEKAREVLTKADFESWLEKVHAERDPPEEVPF